MAMTHCLVLRRRLLKGRVMDRARAGASARTTLARFLEERATERVESRNGRRWGNASRSGSLCLVNPSRLVLYTLCSIGWAARSLLKRQGKMKCDSIPYRAIEFCGNRDCDIDSVACGRLALE